MQKIQIQTTLTNLLKCSRFNHTDGIARFGAGLTWGISKFNLKGNKPCYSLGTYVLYSFDQRLGAAQVPFKRWSKYVFNVFCAKKVKKRKKQEICSKIRQKNVFFKFAPKRWLSVCTSIWSVQHPNLGQNIQHICYSPKTY